MAIYIMDYENVGIEGFNGLESLSEKDRIIIFYSKNADRISIAVHKRLCNIKTQVDFIEAHVGTKNSLDFQLVTYLGSLVEKSKNNQFFLVSKDTGYAPVILFWQERHINIEQVNNVSGQNKKTLENELTSLLPEFKADIASISYIIMQYKSKQGINNALVKKFQSKNAGIIYKKIKPLIADKKGKQ